jgi:hypothetical protein
VVLLPTVLHVRPTASLPQLLALTPYALLSRLQPVRETRERQLALWKEFIVDYCRAHRVRRNAVDRATRTRAYPRTACAQIFVVAVDEDTPLFVNSAINRAFA